MIKLKRNNIKVIKRESKQFLKILMMLQKINHVKVTRKEKK